LFQEGPQKKEKEECISVTRKTVLSESMAAGGVPSQRDIVVRVYTRCTTTQEVTNLPIIYGE